MGKRSWRALSAMLVTFALAVGAAGPGWAQAPPTPTGEDSTVLAPGTQVPDLNDDMEAQLLAQDQAFISGRLAGATPLSVDQAVALRKAAADKAALLKNPPPPGPTTFGGAWSALGPNPISQLQRSSANTFTAESGRIGALAIRKNGQFILGAAQGGIWLYNPATGIWSPRT